MQAKKALIQTHIAVLLFGFSGLFGKLIDLPAPVMTWGRVCLSSMALLLFLLIRRTSLRLLQRRDFVQLFIAGAVLATHWTAFMQSVKVSTVAIATLTFATFPLFAAFLEPILYRERFARSQLISAVVMLFGVSLIVPDFSAGNSMFQGVLWGMLSSATYASLSLINRSLAEKYPSPVISFYEQGVAAVVLLPVMLMYRPVFTMRDVGGLVLLGVLCTAVSHTLFINSIKKLKVQTAGIITGMESVYGILLALVFLQEIPSAREWIGGAVILSVVFYSTIRPQQKEPQEASS